MIRKGSKIEGGRVGERRRTSPRNRGCHGRPKRCRRKKNGEELAGHTLVSKIALRKRRGERNRESRQREDCKKSGFNQFEGEVLEKKGQEEVKEGIIPGILGG